MTDMPRPPKWDDWLPEAERWPDDAWEAVHDTDWTVSPEVVGRPCRYGGWRAGFCRQPSVAGLLRGRARPTFWVYCPKHLYGRWIEGGRVLNWRVKAIEGADR